MFKKKLHYELKQELRLSNHQVVMITGDSAFTAADVARRLGMLRSSKKSKSSGEKDKDNTIKGEKDKDSSIKEKESSLLILYALGSTGKGSDKKKFYWRRSGLPDQEEVLPSDISFDIADVASIAKKNDLCVTGPALEALLSSDDLDKNTKLRSDFLNLLCPYVCIWSRVSPLQKEIVVLALNESGDYCTLDKLVVITRMAAFGSLLRVLVYISLDLG